MIMFNSPAFFMTTNICNTYPVILYKYLLMNLVIVPIYIVLSQFSQRVLAAKCFGSIFEKNLV